VRFLIFLIFILSHAAFAQLSPTEKEWIGQLNLTAGLPEHLLSTRSVVFYSFGLTIEELEAIQISFQRTGIDAVSYFELDKLTAGKDIIRAFGFFLQKREIANLIFIEREESDFRISITAFNGNDNLIDKGQAAWSYSNRLLAEALKELYRTSSSEQKKLNLLINDVPELDMPIDPILGKRNEFYALDLKVDPLSVPLTGDDAVDKRIKEIFETYYPLKYKFIEPGLSERDMRKQGLPYVLCFVHTRDVAAKELLGFDMSKSESALVSVTYPGDQQQLKNIASNTPVYKFYFKHIDSGNVFFGTRWDADLTWDQALLNQIKGMKAELRLN